MCLFNLYGAHNDVVAVGTQDMCPYNSRVGYAHRPEHLFWIQVFGWSSCSFVSVLSLYLHCCYLDMSSIFDTLCSSSGITKFLLLFVFRLGPLVLLLPKL